MLNSTSRLKLNVLVVALTANVLAASGFAFAEEAAQTGQLTFEENVKPILNARCVKCHGADKRESGLDLRRRFTMLNGGDSGPAIVPNQPENSLLMEYVRDRLMPPADQPQLSESEIEVLREWIASGAAIAGNTEQSMEETSDAGNIFDDAAKRHWAFQPVSTPNPPTVKNRSWVNTPIDEFIMARLEERNWSPAIPASKTTILRRLTFDLTGLPPTPAEIAAFAGDESPDAYTKVVDRLMASERYGERWAQHWLDVVRFAETEGFEYDRNVPDAWRFRDYVIDSLNADKPFDQFVREQIAGDEILPNDPEYQSATIFHRLGAVRRNAGNPEIALSRNEVLTERTNIIGEAFLGLTIGCARCHNHKLEPITQKDYYRLQAYLAATQENDISLVSPEVKAAMDAKAAEVKETVDKLKAQAAEVSNDKKIQVEQQIDKILSEQFFQPPTIPGIRNDSATRTAIHVLRRGVWEHKGVAVGPRPLSVLMPDDAPELDPATANPRTHLANWLTHRNHPLTARVIVNRIWQNHFGAGLVKTANDFGTKGGHPSHPELLDWLANFLMDNGWRLKPLHRMIVMSNAYRQESRAPKNTSVASKDPDNQLISHFRRRRLSSEEIRDAMLSVAGRLNLKPHGPSVVVPVDKELTDLLYDPAQWIVTRDPAEYDRRSIYLIAKRNLRLPFLEVFDAPALQTSCPERISSTHAPQALELLNGRFANEIASAFAGRLIRECGQDRERLIEFAWQLAIGRSPTIREQELSLEFLENQPLQEFAIAVFNLNEFLYVQ